MNAKLTLHLGDDYACIMRPDETTDTAVVLVRDPCEEDVRDLTMMAAAPDMLEALKMVRDAMEASGGWAGDESVWDVVIAAIAKAEGEQS